MNEVNLLAPFVYNRLSGDADGTLPGGQTRPGLKTLLGNRFYEYVIPEGAEYPLCLFTYHSGRDVNGGYGQRLFVEATYLVQIIGEGAFFSDIQPMADRLDPALLITDGIGYTDPVSGLFVMGVMRTENYQRVEVIEGGNRYNHMGGYYRMEAYTLSGEAALTGH